MVTRGFEDASDRFFFSARPLVERGGRQGSSPPPDQGGFLLFESFIPEQSSPDKLLTNLRHHQFNRTAPDFLHLEACGARLSPHSAPPA